MGVMFLLLIPVIALIIDLTSWAEACFIKNIVRRPDDNRTQSVMSYFQMGGLLIRLVPLCFAILFAWLGSRSSDENGIAIGALTIAFFIMYVGIAIWSFYHNLINSEGANSGDTPN